MRLVIDTNVLVSALLSAKSTPALLIDQWRDGRFDLLMSSMQIDELMRVTRYPRIRERLRPSIAGRMINEIRNLAIIIDELPVLDVSSDPDDNHLLALAVAGSANFLITGDKRDLLSLKRHASTRILSVRTFLGLHHRFP